MVQDVVLAEISVHQFAIVIDFADGEHEVEVKIFVFLGWNLGIF